MISRIGLTPHPALGGSCYAHNPGEPRPRAVALYCFANGNRIPLCQVHVDMWLDNADDDPDMEPVGLLWLHPAEADHG